MSNFFSSQNSPAATTMNLNSLTFNYDLKCHTFVNYSSIQILNLNDYIFIFEIKTPKVCSLKVEANLKLNSKPFKNSQNHNSLHLVKSQKNR